jgi:hypothetical protein
MGKLNYTVSIINELDKLSLSIFEPFFTYITNLRIKNKTCNADNRTYNIEDIFNVIINHCSDNTTLRDSIDYNSNFNDTPLSTLSYWLNKIYKYELFDDAYYNIYNFSNSLKNYLFLSPDDPLFDLYSNYNILVGDGTISNASFKNDQGKNMVSYTNSIIMNTKTNMVYDHCVQFDNNELTAVLNTKLTKSDIIVLDRGYSKLSFMDKLSKQTFFVIRLTKNLLIHKNFMKTNKNSIVINRNGYDIKLIKYKVDDETRKIIKDRYMSYKKDNDDVSDEDNDKIFVIATNLTNLSFDQIANLYKKRWNIEVCNKYIKSNFNVRHIVKQCNSTNTINKITFYTSLSILMYNVTMLEKLLLEKKHYYEHQKAIKYDYSQSVIVYKRYIIDTINPCYKKILMTRKQKENRMKVNKRTILKKKIMNNNKKRGKYKSLYTVAKLNKNEDIINKIKKYYNRIKKIKCNRENKIIANNKGTNSNDVL